MMNYTVTFQNGKFISLSNSDSTMVYEEKYKSLTVRDSAKDNFLQLQLHKNGITFRTKDTLFVLNTIPIKNFKEGYSQTIFQIKDFNFVVQYFKDRIDEIDISINERNVNIHVFLYDYSRWEIFDKIDGKSRMVLNNGLTSNSKNLIFIDRKDQITLSIRTRRNGRVKSLHAYKSSFDKIGLLELASYLSYSHRGNLISSSESKFDLSCID